MRKDKLHSFEQSLLYSDQAESIKLSDGRVFKCLINPSKLTEDYDWKVLSVPYWDTAINSCTGTPERVNLKCGDTFTWVENRTHWIVYLHHLEEEAYFRAEIRKCEEELVLENGSRYWIHWKGPEQDTLTWNSKQGLVWNDMNNTASFYIKENEETKQYLKRFAIITIADRNWEVQVVDHSQGLLKVALKETFSNKYEEIRKEAEEVEEQKKLEEEWEHRNDEIKILGETEVYPYSVHTYTIIGANGGSWYTSNSKLSISAVVNNTVTVEVTTGKSGNSNLIYRQIDGEEVIFPVTINSL